VTEILNTNLGVLEWCALTARQYTDGGMHR